MKNSKRWKLAALTLAVIMSVSLTSQTVLAASTSSSEKHAYISGYEDGTFKPDSCITRAEVAQILYNLSDKKNTSAAASFSDVSSNDWYYEAVAYLESLDILQGYSDSTFKPNNTIKRGELVAMLERYYGEIIAGTNSFTDVPGNHWAGEYIDSAVAHNWINGYTDGTFKPEDSATRAETVKISNKMLGHHTDVIPENCGGFSDVSKSHWAYNDIMEAYYGTDGILTAERAKEIALDRVGGGTVTKCELDYEHGVLVYEIEIIYGRYEYEIEINATTGAIIKYEKDHD